MDAGPNGRSDQNHVSSGNGSARDPLARRPTQADVARLAGVSQTVVSHVLNGTQPRSMTAATRERVQAAIEELGYIPHQTARSLRLQRTRTIGVFVPDIVNPFYGQFVRGVQDAANRHGYDLIAYSTDSRVEAERRVLKSALSGRMDGVIGSTFYLEPEDVGPLTSRGIPVAILGGFMLLERGVDLGVDTSYVSDRRAASTMVGHLIDQGHRRVAVISGEEGSPPQRNRVAGYCDEMHARGLPTDPRWIRTGEFTEPGGYQEMQALLALDPRPTAVFAANDLIAIGAMTACREAGVRIPEDLIIGGLDDIPAAALISPPLTTINQHHLDQGGHLFERVLDRLEGRYTGPGRSSEGEFELIVRQSTAAGPAS
jgi:LacI family transcriptional regulator